MTKPKVTVIVPVYNAATYLGQCLDSVIAQTCDDWTLIAVNDGSTDDSEAICRRYAAADSRITLISQQNNGLSSARNTALDSAESEYVFFLDADDELYPDALEHLTATATTLHADITAGRPVIAASSTLPKTPPTSKTTIVDADNLCSDILFQKPGTDTSVCWKLYRRSLFDNLRFYDGKFEDLEIFHKLLRAARKVAVSDKAVYFYRQHDDSFIHRWSPARKDIIHVTAGILATMEAQHHSLVDAARHRHFSAAYSLLLSLLRHDADDRQCISECIKIIKGARRAIMFDPRSRIKNRIAAALSYLGMNTIKLMALCNSKY